MERYVCIHSHFYQPPREHPWLEAIEGQDSAYPYHDWNERITAECYRPNTHARILDEKGRVLKITNNYAKTSFNFGPTLLSWMKDHAPDVYQGILDADKESQELFSGHGSALAQVYNHVIMPLSNYRDKETQIIWGLRDFENRFGRPAEGMWLAETAVDVETLEILAQHGLKFTILAPRQAKRVRKLGDPSAEWKDASQENIDPSTAYSIRLPSGRQIALFFYDGPISKAVAFEKLLNNGETFASRLLAGFNQTRPWPQLMHIATDGETYGHHHKHGEMALAYTLHHIEAKKLAKITVYGEFLAKYPPQFEVEIFDNSSWSCAHGIERWRSDCGCNSGMQGAWRQGWRGPLREALDWLRDEVGSRYEAHGRELLQDAWRARNDYISVMLDRSHASIQDFIHRNTDREVNAEERSAILKLQELQRHALYMYTSCGWFFDEISGIETVQNLHYAGRVIDLAEQLWKVDLEPEFLRRLEKAPSNLPVYSNGRQVYEKFVRPGRVDLMRVAAHFAVSSLFEDFKRDARIFSYRIHLNDNQNFGTGNLRLSIGQGTVESQITLEKQEFSYGILYFGDHNLHAGVRPYQGPDEYQKMLVEASTQFLHADFPAVLRCLDKYFGASTFSLKSLFGDEQKKILNRVLTSTLATVEETYNNIYKTHYPLILYLSDIHNPLLKAFQPILEHIKNKELAQALRKDPIDSQELRKILAECQAWEIRLESLNLSRIFQNNLERKMEHVADDVRNIELIRNLTNAVDIVPKLPFSVELWKVQDLYYDILQTQYEENLKKASEPGIQEWLNSFRELGKRLSIRVSQ